MKEDINIYQATWAKGPQSTLVLLLSSQKDNENTLLPSYTLADTTVLFLGFLLYFCCKLTCNDIFQMPCKLGTSFRSLIILNEAA